MSHNVRYDSIKYSDVALLQKALAELQRDNPEAAGYRFVAEKTTIRGWAGRSTSVDAAIICPGQRYDIGFQRGADGVLTPMMESGFAAPGLATSYSAKALTGNSPSASYDNRLLGQLTQRYALLGTEANARNQGIMTRRIAAADGQIQLEVIGK